MDGAPGLSFLLLFGLSCFSAAAALQKILQNIKYKVLKWLFLCKFAKLETVPLR